MQRHGRLHSAEVKDAKIDLATLRRAWGFARAYRGQLIAHLGTIVLAALVGTLPPLVFKVLIDNALPPGHRDPGLVNWLVAAAVALAVAITGLNLVNRWLGSRIGEGLIYDLRVTLYNHVQRMPIAFFTRAQTGSLMSRLSSDVLGAQQTVGTAASATSDVFTLAFTLTAMLALSWKATLLSLVVIPGFVLLDRRLARRLAALSRRRMALNADMSSTMTERLGVAGALAGQAVRPPRRRVEEHSPTGRPRCGMRASSMRSWDGSITERSLWAGPSAPRRCTGWAAMP